MKTMYADYNATTESGNICLTTRGSQDDIQRLGVRPGDWVWLSDSEVVVGARVDVDPYYGIVGVPDWETLVHLDDEEAEDFQRVWGDLQSLFSRTSRTAQDEAKVFELLTQFDHFAPQEVRDQGTWQLAASRASALFSMGKFELALIEIQAARSSRPGDPSHEFLYLEILRQLVSDRAVDEAGRFAAVADAPAMVLAAAINILGTRAEESTGDVFASRAAEILRLCERFEIAPGRPDIDPSLLAIVHFNRGMILRGLDRADEARAALNLAHEIAPFEDGYDEAARTIQDGPKVREIASRIRSRPLRPAA